jgi:Holliday junction DNA helicase RuvA
MIGRIAGSLLEKNPPQIVVDVHGLGYELDVPMSTFYNLPATGQPVKLFTHFAVREDGHFLYGFASEDERAAFRQLIKVSGVGARIALAVLSGLSVSDLQQAVTLQEAGRLVRVPGIGKKTAERLLVELRDKLPAIPDPGPATVPTDASAEAERALVALGYKPAEAARVVASVRDELEQAGSTMDVVRAALKRIARQAEASA